MVLDDRPVVVAPLVDKGVARIDRLAAALLAVDLEAVEAGVDRNPAQKPGVGLNGDADRVFRKKIFGEVGADLAVALLDIAL